MHVFITGASAGIGEALAREWHRRGARLTLVARRKERMDALAHELGKGVLVAPADLSVPRAVDDVLARAEEANGPVDVLVNNAGVQIVAPAHETDLARGDELLALNLMTPLRLVRLTLPTMLARKRGTIVNVSSMAALSPVPGMLYYNAAKGGLANASEALRGELWGTGVNVLTVYPGPVHTDMGDRAIARYEPTLAARLTPWGTTDELASLVVRAVELGSARVIYPRPYAVSRWLPNLSRWLSLRFAPALKSGE